MAHDHTSAHIFDFADNTLSRQTESLIGCWGTAGHRSAIEIGFIITIIIVYTHRWVYFRGV